MTSGNKNMDSHKLPFANIKILRNDIAEVIINDGIEMTLDMVEEYHHFLITHLVSPFSLLINKINKYTYEFDAQIKLATLKEINVMAVVAYNQTTNLTTQNLAAMPREKQWELSIFSNREKALVWLTAEQDLLKLT